MTAQRRHVLTAVLCVVLQGCSSLSEPTNTNHGPVRVAFFSGPTNAVKDTAFPSPITVRVLDASGSLITSSTIPITVSIGTNPGKATLGGAATVNAVSGVATFTGLSLDSVGTGYTLVAHAGTLFPDTSPAFNVTLSLADVDGDGYSPNSGDCNDARADIHPGATDFPDSTFTDSNCDGIDGDKAKATFVSISGEDSTGCGPEAAPCQTVAVGIARAVAAGKRDVYIAAGAYAGGIALADGVNLFGGFSAAFARGPGNTVTLTGRAGVDVGLPDSQAVTIAAVGLTQFTWVADVTLVGAAAIATDSSGGGRGSYVVFARNVTVGRLELLRDLLIGAAGADGAAGGAGTDAGVLTADAAMNGSGGGDAAQYSATCDDTSHAIGGAGGSNGSSGDSSTTPGKGGDGGRMDTNCACCSFDFTATPGLVGGLAHDTAAGSGHGGAGGTGSTNCGPGSDGEPGLIGNGTAGSGGTGTGSLALGLWVGGAGGTGGNGSNGGGGGGGGGAGGCDNGTDSYGAGGGGGGAGGIAAVSGGKGGGPGGGSFGVYLLDAAVTVAYSWITAGQGGRGGAGGVGGQGQSGGSGGSSGVQATNGSAGGQGGQGGHGGHGGGGGGGAGGISYGIYVATGASVLSLLNTGITVGTGGGGGSGGASAPNAPVAERDGNAGQAGAAGTAGSVGSCASPGGC